MPDRRSHRGPHPEDADLFAPRHIASLRSATHELSWLLERGYRIDSSLKLVGDRYALTSRQRAAVQRCACPDSTAHARMRRLVPPERLAGESVRLDGFNVLTTLEVALGGGVVLIGRDSLMRDIAGVHGSYRRVEETVPALELLRDTLVELGVARCEWLLDAPVSNSGRLCQIIRELASRHDLAWTTQTVPDPDRLLVVGAGVVASADGEVLDAAAVSCNLARLCVERALPHAFVVDLSCAP